MKSTMKAVTLGVLVALLIPAVNAQDVFVLPGSVNGSSTVSVFGESVFNAVGTFTANPAADLVLSNPSGSLFYVISNSGSDTILTVNSGLTSVTNIASLGQQATSAVLAPNGQYLIVGAGGTVQIYSTTTNASVAGSGIAAPSGSTVVDVAASLDSSTAFGLAASGTGSELIAISLSNDSVTGTVSIPGNAQAVSIGPNDLLYVSTANLVMVIDPRTLSIVAQISVSGTPGKIVFTPDGTLALAPNTNPVTGTSLWAITTASNTINSTSTILSTDFPANVILTKLFAVTDNRVLAYSLDASTLFDITLNPLAVTTFTYSTAGSTSAAAVSSNIATTSNAITHYVFFVIGSSLYRVDLTANAVSQLPLSTTAGALSVAGPVTTGTPASLLIYGNNQSVALSANSEPLVVRVTDVNGNPLQGVPVTFSTNGGTLTSSSGTTSDDGFALTSLNAPATAGAVTVTASAGTLSEQFTVNVGSSGTSTSGGIAITAGQGQILNENSSTLVTGSHLVANVTNASGTPVPNALVEYAITSGNGTLVYQSSNGTAFEVSTDNNGNATIDFLASMVNGSPFVTTTITATLVSSGASVTFYTTTIPAGTSPTTYLVQPTSGAPLMGQAGQTLPGAIQVQVATASGTPLPYVGLELVNQSGSTSGVPSASCAGGFALSNSAGTITCNVVLGGVVGTAIVTPYVGYFVNLSAISITIAPGPPATVAIVQGNNQSGKPGATLPLALVVQVSDAFGNLLSGTTVTWAVSPSNGATLSNVIGTTDSAGKASALATLGNVSGPVQVTATAGGITQTFTLTVTVTVGGIVVVSGNNQTALVGSAFGSPLVVQVNDANGNPVGGATVAFTVTAGSASVGTAAATTGSNGQASTAVTAGTSAGPITITATAGSFSTTFSLTSRLPGPANITIYNGPDFAAGFPIQTISPGGIATITGVGIAPSVQGLVAATDIVGPLPTSLAGVSVTFNGTAAPIYYVLNNNATQQVTVQVPFEVQPGNTTVVVNAAGGGSATVTVPVQPYAPGAFTTTFSGQTIAVAERSNGSFVSPTNPAQPGENITFFVTGLGQTSPGLGDGYGGVAGQQVTANLIVGINNAGVALISATSVPGMPGVYAVTVQIPNNTPAGNVAFGLIAIDAQGNQYWMQSPLIPVS